MEEETEVKPRGKGQRDMLTQYGCGCERVEGEDLCKEHGRY